MSGFYAYLIARADTVVAVNPVPRGLSTRRHGGTQAARTAPLVRVPRTLPMILSPGDVDRLVAALRTGRDRAMVLAMLLGGLRRCEVLGLRLGDVQVADRRVFIAEGKGGHHRVVPVANRFFDVRGDYLHDERPPGVATDRVFVVLKGRRRGQPLSAEGLDEILDGARRRAGLTRATCHQLRHTCLTRLREAGMALEAVQAQAGHLAKIDALYGQEPPPALPADYETTGMARLRREAHARMLGNGLCTRPVELDCRMESACETCAYFRTSVEYLPILTRQRDHAAERGQTERAELFNNIIGQVDDPAT